MYGFKRPVRSRRVAVAASSLAAVLIAFYAADSLVPQAEACLCHVIPRFSCPPPPRCCESGYYTFDECGCCMTCAKAELQECGGPSGSRGKCSKGLACLKTCSKSNESIRLCQMTIIRLLGARDPKAKIVLYDDRKPFSILHHCHKYVMG